jgi:hypothetical protein
MKITIYGWRIEELPLHPQLGDLAAQPAQLLAFAASQPLKLTLVDADLLDPLAQRLAVEAELPGDLGVRKPGQLQGDRTPAAGQAQPAEPSPVGIAVSKGHATAVAVQVAKARVI